MEAEQDNWDELINRVAEGLTEQIRREYYQHYLHIARNLSSPSEKLVYIYLALFQPQTLSTLRRGLGLHENTVIKALRSLREKDRIQRDDEYLWWIK
ncbi:TPA: hypothetical protein HA344_06330 [Candidatus Bathyarchaeota archaeon]|nr:hypothetical protein [Candidatus Bathyarchaeota archaeon]